MIRIGVTGLTAAKRKLGTLGNSVANAFETSIVEQTQAVMIAAQNAVPIYTGSLRSTAYLRPRKRGRARWWDFGYRSPYAAFVHDHPNGHTNEDGHPCACYATIHKPRAGMMRNGHGYKWLEKVVKAHGNFVTQAIEAVRSAIASGFSGGSPADPTLEGAASGALPASAHKARLARNRALIAAGKRNAGGGGGGGSANFDTSAIERERQRQEAERKRTLREYLKAALKLAKKRKP